MEALPATAKVPRPRVRFQPPRVEVLLVFLYLIFGGLWIVLTHQAIDWLAGKDSNDAWVQAGKGLAFIGPTAVLLHILLRRSFRQLESTVESARALSERFELVARASNDAIWDWNLLTDEIWWSEGFQNLFGYPKGELEPNIQSWTSCLHEEDRQRTVAGLRAAIDSGEPNWSDEYRFRRKDGSYAHVFDRGIVVRDKKKQAGPDGGRNDGCDPAQTSGGAIGVVAPSNARPDGAA